MGAFFVSVAGSDKFGAGQIKGLANASPLSFSEIGELSI